MFRIREYIHKKSKYNYIVLYILSRCWNICVFDMIYISYTSDSVSDSWPQSINHLNKIVSIRHTIDELSQHFYVSESIFTKHIYENLRNYCVYHFFSEVVEVLSNMQIKSIDTLCKELEIFACVFPLISTDSQMEYNRFITSPKIMKK